jgi:hypothetical protein
MQVLAVDRQNRALERNDFVGATDAAEDPGRVRNPAADDGLVERRIFCGREETSNLVLRHRFPPAN